MKKSFLCLCLCIGIFLSLTACGDTKKVDEAYTANLVGKTFQAKDGQMITFYEEGVATYDYRNGVGENHHYCYAVTVVSSSEDAIEMTFETVLTDSEVFHNEDYIDNGPEPATYFFADDTLKYYHTYSCLYDPEDTDFFSNTYGEFHTVCAMENCRMYIAPAGHTKFCVEHAAACEYCENFVDPGVSLCPGCPYCRGCGIKIESCADYLCGSCFQKEYIPSQNSDGGKCHWCNGTGAVKYYYGGSDLEAYFDGHDPYWYGQCGSCGGNGKN